MISTDKRAGSNSAGIKRKRDIDYTRSRDATRRAFRFLLSRNRRNCHAALFTKPRVSFTRVHVDSLMRCRVFAEIVPIPITKRPQQVYNTRDLLSRCVCISVVFEPPQGRDEREACETTVL